MNKKRKREKYPIRPETWGESDHPEISEKTEIFITKSLEST